MIQPVKKGAELAIEIRETVPEPGTIAVWWLGQSGFVYKSRFGTLVIDPYLSESLTIKYEGTDTPHIRMTECPLRGDEVPGVDLVLASHKHTDHLDARTLSPMLGANPSAELCVPEALIHHSEKLGLPSKRLVGLDDGWEYERAGFKVRALPSAHEGLDKDAAGLCLYLGFVVEADGVRFYHSGDSVVYDGLAENLGPGPFDAFFLPINGWDPRRRVPGNMSAAEAVELANTCRPRWLVPHHYDLFTFNTVPVAEFIEAARGLTAGVEPVVLRCGQRWEIRS
ncbi:MBL fold metallo-hydrolase [Tautonia sociabilis]|uniref:MBL fold metallo-hydrolase n=1 Tax=Tautonia sociabilis TaxID=2080755 RepID=A0A432MDA0_9BACT|nr:MBL fold metallo-hydrolase [Tautonia sociabilis]